jgi:PAS domain S-box-containing protein
MKSGGKLSLKRTKLFLAVFEVIVITIETVIFLSIINIFIYIWHPKYTPLMNGLMTIILASIGSAVFAYILFHNLPGRQTIIQKLTEEKYNTEEQLNQIAVKLEESIERMGHETAERARVEKALSESESKLREIIQKAPTGIVLLDDEGIIMECNPAFQKMLGYAPEELIGVRFFQAVHPDDIALSREQFKELLEGKSKLYRVEHRYINKDLREVWGLLSASLVRDNDEEPQFAIAIIEDITERRQAEKKILNYQRQLRSLTSELSLTEENNRRRLATNLHDHIGQVLSLVRIKISELEESLSQNASQSLIKEISKSIDQTIKYTRYLMFEISPPILYDLGLEETIEWLAEHFTKEYDIQIQVTRDPQPKPLSIEARILLFQAVRELLDNIVKHANATVVKTSIQRACNDVKVIVEDNGVGFDPSILDPQLNRIKGFGLFSIFERLGYFGGSLEIESELGQGTRAILLIPMIQSEKISWSDFQEKYMQICVE